LTRIKARTESVGRRKYLQFLRHFKYFCVVENSWRYANTFYSFSPDTTAQRDRLAGDRHVPQLGDAVRKRRVRAEKPRKELPGRERRDDTERCG
jgi:hypothetical protein